MSSSPSIRRRRLVPVALGLVAVGLLGYGAVSSGAAARHAARVTRIHLVEREAQVTFLDEGKRGLSSGDHRLVVSRIFTPAGRRIGRLDADCVITGVGALFGGTCHGVLTLPRGQIAGESAFSRASDRARTVHQAITGGTDAFRGARGQFVVRQVAKGPTPFVLELVR
jgi:hypothetical protein